jgi:predicted ArsR family transcriptional regulator
MKERSHLEDVAAIASIGDPLRRSLFEYVARSAAAVGRDEAANALGIARATAAFHLDRLTESGLLETEFQRRTGRTGPGSGRPAKLYRPAAGEFVVSVPERHYELAAELFSAAIEESDRTREPILEALDRVSADYGRGLGERAGSLAEVLRSTGYEPDEVDGVDGVVTLTNCPFHRLAKSHTQIVCTTNVALLQGAAVGAGEDQGQVQFHPTEGRCCVRIIRDDSSVTVGS